MFFCILLLKLLNLFCLVVLGLWFGLGPGLDGVAVVDVTAVGAAIALVLLDATEVCLLRTLPRHAGLGGTEGGVWLHGTGFLLHLVTGLLLPGSSGSATSAVASAKVVLSASLNMLLLALYWLLELHWLLTLH